MSDEYEYGPSRMVVNVEGEWISVDQVEFLDIQEGLQGEDVMTFGYQGEIYKRTVMRK